MGVLVGHQVLGRVVLEDSALAKVENLVALDDRVESVGNGQDRRVFELLTDQLLDRLLSHDIDVCGGLVEEHNSVVAEDGTDNADELALADTEVLAFFLNLELQALSFLFFLILLLLFCLLGFDLVSIFLLLFLGFLVGFLAFSGLILGLGVNVSFLLFILFFFLLLFLVLSLLLGSALEEVLKASLLDKLDDALIWLLVEGVQVVAEGAREKGWVLGNHRDLLAELPQRH